MQAPPHVQKMIRVHQTPYKQILPIVYTNRRKKQAGAQ